MICIIVDEIVDDSFCFLKDGRPNLFCACYCTGKRPLLYQYQFKLEIVISTSLHVIGQSFYIKVFLMQYNYNYIK